MGKYYLKKFLLASVFIAFAMIIEVVTFSITGLGYAPKYIWMDLLLMMVVGGVIFLVPGTIVSLIISILVLLGQCLISLVNVNLFSLYGDLFTTDLLTLANDFAGAVSISYIKIPFIIVYFTLFVLAAGTSIVIAVVFKKRFKCNEKNLGAVAIILALMMAILPSCYIIQERNLAVETSASNPIATNDLDLYKNFTYKTPFFEKFGTYPMYFVNFILGKKPGKTQTVDTMTFQQYFLQNNQTPKSEYFGVDQGNNLIVVMLESLDTFLINREYTPTLYELQQNGINFTNYHSKAKTNYSEMSVVLGSYPFSEDIVELTKGQTDENGKLLTQYSDYYNFSLPNVLKANGFEQANYFHLNEGSYYSRNRTHTAYGFDNAYFTDDYDEFNYGNNDSYDYIKNWNLPERWFIDAAQDKFVSSDSRFMTFLTTINAHGGYTNFDFGGAYAQGFKDMIHDDDFGQIKDTNYYRYFKNALAEAMVVDDGIKYLMDLLKAEDLLDKTTILFYTDHNAYSDLLSYSYKDTTVFESESYNVPAFIYSPNLKNKQINKFTVSFDLTVTLFELLGIDYNPLFYLGNSAFSKEASLAVSHTTGIFNDLFFTFDAIDIKYQHESATNKDFKEFQNTYLDLCEKWEYINMLYLLGNPENA